MFNVSSQVRYTVSLDERVVAEFPSAILSEIVKEVQRSAIALLGGRVLRISGSDGSLFVIKGEWMRLPSLELSPAEVRYFQSVLEEKGSIQQEATLGRELAFLERTGAEKEFVGDIRQLVEQYGSGVRLSVLLEAHFRKFIVEELEGRLSRVGEDPALQEAFRDYLQAYIVEGLEKRAELWRRLGLKDSENSEQDL